MYILDKRDMRFWLIMFCVTIFVACDKEQITEVAQITKGRDLFRSNQFSSDGQTSCATCHPDGHMDNRKWHFAAIHDTTAGIPDSFRTITLWGIAQSGAPYLWKNSFRSLESVTRLYTDTIMGGIATEDEIAALVAYQRSLIFPGNPNLANNGLLTEVQARGKSIFDDSRRGNCAPCHQAPTYGNPIPKNIYTGGTFRTIGLRGIYSMAPYFHNGSAKTLHDVIEHYAGNGLIAPLTPQERDDLVEYLKTL